MTEFVIPGRFNLVALESVDSTNEEIKRLAIDGSVEGTLVWALEQKAGRGRRGRTWHSPPGNLYCSLLLRPDYPASKAMQLSFVTAVAVAEAVATILPWSRSVTCKWPNDILVDSRKVAGILIESSSAAPGNLDWLAIGVGVNVASHPPDFDAPYPPTSLAAEGMGRMSVRDVLRHYCGSLHRWMTTWHEAGFSTIRRAWLGRAHGLNHPITVRLEGETVEGIFVNLGEDGALVLGQGGFNRLITAGDVFPARSSQGT